MDAEGTGKRGTCAIPHVSKQLVSIPLAMCAAYDPDSDVYPGLSTTQERTLNLVNLCRDLRKAVDGLVGRVNGKYGKTDYCPIHYVKKKLNHR